MKPKFVIVIAFLVFTLISGARISRADDSELAELFQERGLVGTTIISSLDGKTEYIHNTVRSENRFVPASTFKILNTLIVLKEVAVRDEKEVIKWDRKDKGYAEWNRDQTIETAFPASCVWFYQKLARRIGREKYITHFRKIGYGNEKASPEVTSFWLEGDLAISAREQVIFLKKLFEESLPYCNNAMRLVKSLMIVQETPDFIIRAKTGWAMRTDPQQGWYVGYVETKGQVWFFATNFEIKRKGDEVFRKEITIAALKVKGIL
jgi:beta-lactamase class D